MILDKLEILSISFLIVTILLILSLQNSNTLYVKEIAREDNINNGVLTNPSTKNIIMYKSMSSGCCAAQKLEIVEKVLTSDLLLNTELGISTFTIKIPPKSISDVTNVNVTPTIGRNKWWKPILANELINTTKFLDWYVEKRKINPLGAFFNPDWYVTTLGLSLPETINIELEMPPTFQIIYNYGDSSPGTCQRYYWSGYITNIRWGSLYEGVSSYEIDVEGTSVFDDKFLDTYPFNHKRPDFNLPHFHQEPRINGVKNQILKTEIGLSNWAITIGDNSEIGIPQNFNFDIFRNLSVQEVNLTNQDVDSLEKILNKN